MPQVAGFIVGAMGWGGAFAGATGAFAAGITAAASAGIWTTLAVRLATSVALSALSRALAPKPKVTTPGIRTEATMTGGVNAEGFILGRFATAGVAVCPPMSQGKSGETPNAWLTYVIELSGIPGAELAEVLIDGTVCAVSQASPHATYGNRLVDAGGRYTGKAWVRYHDGSQTAPDAALRSLFGTAAARPWTSSMVGGGIAYAVVTFKYDREVFQNYPNVLFVLDGLRLYDPRQDTTAGGQGAQRWDDPGTWTFSANALVMVYNILRGITLPNGDIWGGGIAAADLPYLPWAAAMDACDAQAAITGGTETAIEAGGEVFVDDEPFSVIDDLLTSANAKLAERGGVWTPRVGGPGLPVLHITDGDLLIDRPDEYAPFPNISQVFNGIEGQWTDPESAWQPRDADPILNATWEDEDNGRRLVASLQMPMVTRGTQAQRLMAAAIADHRRMRVHQISLGPGAAVLEPLDTITWTSASNGYVSKTFEVARVEREMQTGLTGVTLREIDAGDFNPITVTRPAPPDRTPLYPVMQAVEGWDAVAWAVKDAGSNDRRAAIKAIWEPDGALDARGVRVAIRLDGDAGDGNELPLVDVAAGEVLVLDVLPGESYELRARYQVDRPTLWTAWKRVSAPDVRLSPEDFDADTGGFFTAAPAVPAGLAASSQTDTLPGGAQQATVHVSWSPAAHADSYDLEITPDGQAAMVRRVGGTSYSFVAVPGSGWGFRVRGKSASGKVSAWSAVKTHTATSDNTPPAVPAGLAAVPGVNSIWLTWDENLEPDLARYEIFMASAASPAPLAQDAPTWVTGATSHVVQGLGAQAQRWFWLRAVDTSGNRSAWSASVTATTAVGAAVDPASLQAVLDDVVNAGIVPGQALAAHSILGLHMALTDFENLTLNGSFDAGLDGWTIWPSSPPADYSVVDVAADGQQFTKALKITCGDGAQRAVWWGSTQNPYDSQPSIPVQEGDVFWVRAWVKSVAASAGFQPRIRCDIGASGGSRKYANIDTPITPGDADNEWIEVSAQVTVPASGQAEPLRKGLIQLQVLDDGDGTGYWLVSGVEVRRANAAKLLVDGGIYGHHLVADEAVITGTAQIGTAVIEDANVANISSISLTVNSQMVIEQGGSLSYGKGSTQDELTEGIYFGRDDDGTFGLAFSRVGGSGEGQSLVMNSASGLALENARFTVRAAGSVTSTTVTTDLAKTALPGGTAYIRFPHILGGGGGGATRYFSEQHIAGSNGLPTIVRLYDGAVLMHEITASGGARGAWGDRGGQNSPWGSSAGMGANATGYGAGGSGNFSGAGTSGGIKGGSKAAQPLSREWIDVSGWGDPQIEIQIGAGGSGAPPVNERPNPGVGGGNGSPGRVIYELSLTANRRADVVTLAPTAVGTFAKAANTPGSFPDLGPGWWRIRDSGGNAMALGSITIADGVTVSVGNDVGAVFYADQTPAYSGGAVARTITYAHHAMGVWGD